MNLKSALSHVLLFDFYVFPQLSAVALDTAAFMIGMIALQSIGAGLCTLILGDLSMMFSQR